MILWAGGTQGPVAVPGTYSVRLRVAGTPHTQTFRLLKDPRSKATQFDIQEQFSFLLAIRNRTSQANDAVKLIRSVKSQLADRRKKIPAAQQAAFATAATRLETELSNVEQQIYQVRNQSGQDPLNYPIRLNNKIAALSGVAASTEARPTNQAREVFRLLSAELDKELARVSAATRTALPEVNRELRAAGLMEIVPATTEASAATPR